MATKFGDTMTLICMAMGGIVDISDVRAYMVQVESQEDDDRLYKSIRYHLKKNGYESSGSGKYSLMAPNTINP